MSRFLLSADAEHDIDDILSYLDGVPAKPADQIASSIQMMLHSIGRNPHLGMPHSALTRLTGAEVRSRLVYPYRVFYRFGRSVPEIFAIWHGSRDTASLFGRLQ